MKTTQFEIIINEIFLQIFIDIMLLIAQSDNAPLAYKLTVFKLLSKQ